MDRRLLMEGGELFPGKLTSVAGDFLCANQNGDKIIVSEITEIPDEFAIIGIVVIPASHNVYGTGEGAAMAPGAIGMQEGKYDEYSRSRLRTFYTGDGTPMGLNEVEGTTTAESSTYIYCGTYDNPTNTPSGIGTLIKLAKQPEDNNVDANMYINPHDPITGYYQGSIAYPEVCPSPYNVNGGKNPNYFIKTFNGVHNLLSDMNGFENTDFLYRPVSYGYYIPNNAIFHVKHFETIGTNIGDWYVPSIGELGYYYARIKSVEDSLQKIQASDIDWESKINNLNNSFWNYAETNISSSTSSNINNFASVKGTVSRSKLIEPMAYVKF